MPMEAHDLGFGGVLLSDYGAFFDGSKAFIKPPKDIEFVSVPGRNGDLTFSNNRYSNVDIHFNCYIPTNFVSRYTELINRFSYSDGYMRLEYTTEPGIYRQAYYVASTEPVTGAFNDLAQFDLVFNCKPQKYLKGYGSVSPVDFIAVTDGDTVDNPTYQNALPVFRVKGNGVLDIRDRSGFVTETKVTVSGLNSTDYTIIDSEIQDAYYSAVNRNGNISLTNGFPVIDLNGITVRFTGFSEVGYVPMFWRL